MAKVEKVETKEPVAQEKPITEFTKEQLEAAAYRLVIKIAEFENTLRAVQAELAKRGE